MQVWSKSKLSKTIDVKSLKKHGPINEDGTWYDTYGCTAINDVFDVHVPSSVHFGSFQLSADGSYLLYIAEREKPESYSFFKKPSDEEKGKNAPIQV